MANNKVVYGNTPLIDLTTDTATVDKVANGVQFMGKNGQLQTGTMQLSGAEVSGTKLLLSGTSYIPPSWSSGTDEEIQKAISEHYAGNVNLYNYWNVGDERSVTLSDENVIVLVLRENTRLGGIFDLHPKYITYVREFDNVSITTWDRPCTLKTWVNNDYYNMFPEGIRKLFNYIGNNQEYFVCPISNEYGAMKNKAGQGATYWATTKPKYDRMYYVNTSGGLTSGDLMKDRCGVYPIAKI